MGAVFRVWGHDRRASPHNSSFRRVPTDLVMTARSAVSQGLDPRCSFTLSLSDKPVRRPSAAAPDGHTPKTSPRFCYLVNHRNLDRLLLLWPDLCLFNSLPVLVCPCDKEVVDVAIEPCQEPA